jgi:diguanylate cyclase (GGDEF)-like protein
MTCVVLAALPTPRPAQRHSPDKGLARSVAAFCRWFLAPRRPGTDTETASEVGLGRLVEVYVPLRFVSSGPPAGAFEIYLSYRPIAAALTHDKRMIALLIAIGLGLLWAILYRIVARASRRLRQQVEENDRLARYDQLTGLPNRTLFIERIEAAVRRSERRAGVVGVLLIDLDGFTEINNTLGTANGDLVLCEVARRLRGSVLDDALVARVAGDGYAILVHGTKGVPDALGAAAAIQASFESSIVLDDVEVRVEASIGIAVMGEHADLPNVLLQRAGAALARALTPQRDRGVLQTDRLLSTVGNFAGKESRDGGVIREARERRAVR